MGQNRKFLWMVILLCITIWFFYKPISSSSYIYTMGKVYIENPVLVYYKDRSQFFVCADTAITYYPDSNWIDREDVYPYILVWPKNDVWANHTVCHSNIFQPYRWYDKNYYPFEESKNMDENVILCHFNSRVHIFDAFMQASDYQWCSDNPDEPYADDLYLIRYRRDRYQMVLRHHYSLIQIIWLRLTHPVAT